MKSISSLRLVLAVALSATVFESLPIPSLMGGKWLELLSEIAPGIKRAAIMFNPDTAVSIFLPSFETAAGSLKVVPIMASVHSDIEIETAIVALGREPGGGLVVMPDVFAIAHRRPGRLQLSAGRMAAPGQSCRRLHAIRQLWSEGGPCRVSVWCGSESLLSPL